MAQIYPQIPPDFKIFGWKASDDKQRKSPVSAGLFALHRTLPDFLLVEAGGVEPPSEDSTLRAATCVSGLFGVVVGDPGRQGSRPTIPVRIRPVAPRERVPGYPVRVTPFRLYGQSTVGRSRA